MRPSFFKVEFEWPVSVGGYHLAKTDIAEVVEPPELFYVVTPKEGPALRKRLFEEFPGLFKDFAAMESNPQGVLAFADKFGLLQEDRENELIWWLQYQRDFAELISLKGRARLYDVMVQPFPFVVNLSDLEGLTIALPNSRLGSLDRINRIFESGVTAQVSWSDQAAGIVLQPTSLLAAMALQLGIWLGSQTEYIRQCSQCGATFDYGPGTPRRASRRYCSIRCQEAARYARGKRIRGRP